MSNSLLALLGGVFQGMGQARERKTQEEYKKALIDFNKTQAKHMEQKIQLDFMKHQQEQQGMDALLAQMGGGGAPQPQMPMPTPQAPGSGPQMPQPQSGGYGDIQQQLGGGVIPQQQAEQMAGQPQAQQGTGLIGMIQRLVGGGQKPPTQGGQPIVFPASGKFTSGFNAPRGDRLHYGGDIATGAGEPVVAPANMRITQTRGQMSNSPGGMVWGVDQQGIEHRLHHIQPGAVKIGDVVQAGQPIGTISNIKGPHADYKQYDTRTGQFVDWTKGQAGGQPQGSSPQGQPTAPGKQGQKINFNDPYVQALFKKIYGVIPKGPQVDVKGDKAGGFIIFKDGVPIERHQGALPVEPYNMQVPGDREYRVYQPTPAPGDTGLKPPIATVPIGPSGREKAIEEGEKKQITERMGGVAPDVAAKRTMAEQGIKAHDEAMQLIYDKDGQVNYKNLLANKISLPFSEGRNLKSLILSSIDSVIRAATGASMNKEEIPFYESQYVPSAMDNEATVRQKTRRLREFLSTYMSKMEPAAEIPEAPTTGKAKGSGKNKQSADEVFDYDPKTKTFKPAK